MKWILLLVFMSGATGTVHDAMVDLNVDKYGSYEACRGAALDFQGQFAADTTPMKVFCWRVDTENSGSLTAGGFEPAKNNADSILPSRKR